MPDITNDVIANVPDTVTVSFGRANDSVLVEARYSVDVTLASLALSQYVGYVGHVGNYLIHSSAVGNFTSATTYLTPDNAAELLALAQQIATDFYLWKLASLELRLPSFIDIAPDGMHDLEFWHDNPTTVIHRSGWEPDLGWLKHAGEFGSSDGTIIVITPPGSSTFGYARGISISPISARVGIVCGGGLVQLYSPPGGIITAQTAIVSVRNWCDEIPIGWIVDTFQDPFFPDERNVNPVCEFEPSRWYCITPPVSLIVTDCCPDGIPAVLYLSGGSLGDVTLTWDEDAIPEPAWVGMTAGDVEFVKFTCESTTFILSHSFDGEIWVNCLCGGCTFTCDPFLFPATGTSSCGTVSDTP